MATSSLLRLGSPLHPGIKGLFQVETMRKAEVLLMTPSHSFRLPPAESKVKKTKTKLKLTTANRGERLSAR